jgi:hypothetical protein
MTDNNMEVTIGANVAPLAEGTAEASSVITQATKAWSLRFKEMFSSVSNSAKHMTDQVGHQAKEATEKMELFSSSINKVHKTMALLAEVAVLGWIGDKIWETAKKTAEYAENMELAAQKTGMSTDALQGWSVAATVTGGNADTLLKGVRKLSQELMGVQEGSASSVAAFTKMGMSAEQLKGMKMEEIMLKIADSFKSHEDGVSKAALAQQLFGRSGQQLIPILNMGREGVEGYLQAAKDLGAVMSKEDIEAAAAYKNQMEMLEVGMTGLEHKIGMGLIPAMSGLVSSFQSSVKPGGQLNDVMELLPAAINMVAKVVSYASEAFQILGRRIGATAAIIYEVVHGNLQGAKYIVEEFNKDLLEVSKGA